MPRDVYNDIKVMRSISPVAVGTTGTGVTGKIVDTQGYEGVALIFDYGSITATNAVFTATVKEGDVTGTMTSVADASLIGTEALASPGTGTRTSGSTKNVSKKIGYIGGKRYVQALIKSTVTAAPPVAATVVLSNARHGPAS